MIKYKLKRWPLFSLLLVTSAVITVALGLAVRSPVNCSRSAPAPNLAVALYRDHADPSTLSLPVGAYVQLNSCDGRPHNIGQGSGDDVYHQAAHQDEHDHAKDGLESGIFKPDEGYRLQFKQAGVYHFHDHLNPKITVTVVVYDPLVK